MVLLRHPCVGPSSVCLGSLVLREVTRHTFLAKHSTSYSLALRHSFRESGRAPFSGDRVEHGRRSQLHWHKHQSASTWNILRSTLP